MIQKRWASALALAAFAVSLSALATPAFAQTRIFMCPRNQAVTITVIGPNAISAVPIEGGSMTFQATGNGLKFMNGEYEVTITPDQSSATFSIPDFGDVTCTFQPGASADGRSGIGNIGGPGESQPRRPQRAQRPAALLNQRPAVANQLPMSGRSLGGVVRAGPSQSAARVRSMGENEELEIVSRGPMWNDYNWFRVISGGQDGWQWGGIMCSTAPLDGIFQQCRN